MKEYQESALGRETARKYADILDKSRPDSPESRRKHPRMSLQSRAKIFSPFARCGAGRSRRSAGKMPTPEREQLPLCAQTKQPFCIPCGDVLE